jgi:hypothetical protein
LAISPDFLVFFDSCCTRFSSLNLFASCLSSASPDLKRPLSSSSIAQLLVHFSHILPPPVFVVLGLQRETLLYHLSHVPTPFCFLSIFLNFCPGWTMVFIPELPA